jgi:hypothetical protein
MIYSILHLETCAALTCATLTWSMADMIAEAARRWPA